MNSNVQPAWRWPHLLSLDAPAVALAWQAEWASFLEVRSTPIHYLILGLACWSVYLLDRLADVKREPTVAHRTARHAFAARYAIPIGVLGLAVGCVGAGIAFTQLPGREIVGGLALTGVAILYFVAVHLFSKGTSGWRTKELAVGILFAVGTALFPMLDRSAAVREIIPPLIGFAALLFLNGVLITHRENNTGCVAWVTASLGLIVVVGMTAWVWTGANVWLALAIASLLHLVLDRARDRFGQDAWRVWVDLCLLTPLIV